MKRKRDEPEPFRVPHRCGERDCPSHDFPSDRCDVALDLDGLPMILRRDTFLVRCPCPRVRCKGVRVWVETYVRYARDGSYVPTAAIAAEAQLSEARRILEDVRALTDLRRRST